MSLEAALRACFRALRWLPLVLVLAYYQCPMLCSLVLNGTMESARGVPFESWL